MPHSVTPAARAAAAVLAAPAALGPGVADAGKCVGMAIVDDPTVADEASLPLVVYQPQTGGGDLWHGPFDFTGAS